MAPSREASVEVLDAIYAYRLAFAYRERVLNKWIPRDEQLRKLDSFHRTWVAWENDCYRYERLCACASDALLHVVRGDTSSILPMDAKFFAKCRDRFFLRALKALMKVTKG